MINSQQHLADLVCDGVTILLQRDPKVKMAAVSVAGQCFMAGNLWDFKPECHGGFHYELAAHFGNWATPQGLADILATFLTTKGATNVKVIEEAYEWAAQFREQNEAMA